MPELDVVPLEAGHEAGLRAAFAGEVPASLGVKLMRVGRALAELAIEADGGVVHPGVVALLGQAAADFSVRASLPAGAKCRVVEHKIDYAAGMSAGRLIARGWLVRPGGALSVARAEVHIETAAGTHKLAVLLATVLHDGRS